MVKFFGAAALVAFSLATAPAIAAHRDDMRAESPYGQTEASQWNEAPNRFCPKGAVYQPFPSGYRCELPGGGYLYR